MLLQPSAGSSTTADKSFALLKRDPKHPSLNLKKVGRRVGPYELAEIVVL